jgi:hypothetical protein
MPSRLEFCASSLWGDWVCVRKVRETLDGQQRRIVTHQASSNEWAALRGGADQRTIKSANSAQKGRDRKCQTARSRYFGAVYLSPISRLGMH